MILVDWWRRQEDQSRFLRSDALMREDGFEIVLVVGKGDVLARRASGQAGVVGAEEDGLAVTDG